MTFTAIPIGGFGGWLGACLGQGLVCEVTVTADMDVVAQFTAAPWLQTHAAASGELSRIVPTLWLCPADPTPNASTRRTALASYPDCKPRPS